MLPGDTTPIPTVALNFHLCRILALVVACVGFIVSARAAEPWDDISYRTHFNDLVTEGRYLEAEENARALLAGYNTRFGPASIQSALALDMLTEVYFYGDHVRDPAGEEFARRAIDVKEKLLGPDHLQLALSVRLLARLEATKGDYEHAVSDCERAVAIYQKNPGKDPRREAYAYEGLAAVLTKYGDFNAARANFAHALAIREKYFPPITVNTAGLLSDFAVLYRDMGEYEQSRAMFLRAAAIFEKKWARTTS